MHDDGGGRTWVVGHERRRGEGERIGVVLGGGREGKGRDC